MFFDGLLLRLVGNCSHHVREDPELVEVTKLHSNLEAFVNGLLVELEDNGYSLQAVAEELTQLRQVVEKVFVNIF